MARTKLETLTRLPRLLAAGLALATLATAPAALADGSKDLDGTDARGYGDTIGRLGLGYTMVSGRGYSTDANTGVRAAGDYTRNRISLDFDLYGFWDATRFDTLIGAEFSTRFGTNGTEKFDGGLPEGKGGLFFRMDGAFDYGVVHWDGPMRGRIAFGAGAGMDFAGRWYGSARYYPMLVGRVQLWFGDLGVHASWHHLPTVSGDYTQREHRFELAVGSGSIHGGARFTLTKLLKPSGETEDFNQKELGAFVMWAF
jgi:hypothetical protein